MKHGHSHELTPKLAAFVEATRSEPDAANVDRAQGALMQRLRSTPAARGKPRGPWFAAAAMAMLVLVAFVGLPLLSNGADAFAAVRQHLRDFNVLAMHIEQRLSGSLLQSSRTVVDARGLLRTDIGENLSIVIDPSNERMLTLLHGPRRAMLAPLEGARPSPDASLKWLEELRTFQGQAELLPDTRLIEGEAARGWSLQVEGRPVVLWANAQGLPLEMHVGQAGELQLRFRFEFEPTLPPGYLSSELPDGYALDVPDEH